ncbi:MAG: GntR family transcriptional regulator [Candidatus Methylomirabilales bacterium]
MKIQIHRPLREEVYDALRRAIVQGELPRGRRVVETELAGRLGISRTPVREALRKLEAEGLLSKGPGSNLVVNDMSSKDVEETFSIRAVLEGFAARLAAERATLEQVAKLEKILKRSEALVDGGSLESLLEWNTRFHDGLNALSDSPLLQQLLQGLHDKIMPYRRITLEVGPARNRWLREHRAILKAIKDRDPERAERLIKRHVHRKKETVLAYLKVTEAKRTEEKRWAV